MFEFFTKPAVRITVGILALVALALLLAGPALAHSTIRSINPADGSTVETPPSEVVLTFSAGVIGEFTIVELKGPDGAAVTLTPAVSDGTVVRQPLPPLAAGPHTVTYRIVSADSHPISGTSSFTVTTGNLPRASATATPTVSPTEPSPTTSTPASSAPTPSTSATTGSADEPSESGTPWGWIAAVAVLVAGVGAALAMRRRSPRQG